MRKGVMVAHVGVAAGIRRIEVMPATFSVPAAGVVLADTPFYDDSTVPTFGGDFGVQFAVAPRVRLGVEQVFDGLAICPVSKVSRERVSRT